MAKHQQVPTLAAIERFINDLLNPLATYERRINDLLNPLAVLERDVFGQLG